MLDSNSLLCQETDTYVDAEVVDENISDREGDEEYIKKLLDKEIRSLHLTMIGSWITRARLDAIHWILDATALFGFGYQTAYLSITYFDLFLSRRAIDSEKYWAVRLLSVACLSLAAKMEECRVPLLSDFCVKDYNFDCKVIQKMELLVLNTLEWRMSSITPFDYVDYFTSKFCTQSPQRNCVSRKTIELIFATINDMNLTGHRPSVIAGAATLLAMDQKLTRQAMEFKINAFSLSGFLQIEDVFSCYGRMQELDREKIKLPNYISPDLSPIKMRRANVYGNSYNKREKLTFSDCDQNNDLPDEK